MLRILPLASVTLAVTALLNGGSYPPYSTVSPNLTNNIIVKETGEDTMLIRNSKKTKVCHNKLAVTLAKVGFKGRNHRQAWAIAMRESRGRKKAISSTNDYGVFQFNKSTWGNAHWWDEDKLLKRKYNAKIAYRMSRGGKTWYPWGLTGKGTVNAKAYRASGWSGKQIRSHILSPYQRFYKEYRSLPKECRWRSLERTVN